jgi:hypothetical protein
VSTPVPRLDRYDCALGNKHPHRYKYSTIMRKYRARICKRLRSPGIDSASLCSPGGRFDNCIVIPGSQGYKGCGIDFWPPKTFINSGSVLFIEDQAFLPSYCLTRSPSRQQVVSLSQPFCVSLVELIIVGRGGRRGWGRSQIIQPRESLILFK